MVKEESRRRGAHMSIERQNELFPNNIAFRVQQKLNNHRRKEKTPEKSLDEKLSEDITALMH